VRNTKVIDIYNELKDYGVDVDIFDPWANKEEVRYEYGVTILDQLEENKKYDSIIIAVSHKEFLTLDFGKIKKKVALFLILRLVLIEI
jgi:UDP-N-acetyl-D-galactosamine dehydrogenase